MDRLIASVIISAKNESPHLSDCLLSLKKQKGGYPFEVIVVDNNSTDNTYAVAKSLQDEMPNLSVHLEKKPGSPAARNKGARLAKGEILIFTDADCVFESHWLKEMIDPLLSSNMDYPLGAVGGNTKTFHEKNRSLNIWEKYLDVLFEFWEKDRISKFPAFLPWAPTCNLAVKKSIFDLVGGFDENWKVAAYDVDLCWRIVLSGFVIGYNEDAIVFHKRRSSLVALIRQMENYSYFNSALLTTYESELKLSKRRSRKERRASGLRRLISLAKQTKSVDDAKYRIIDLVVLASKQKGWISSKFRYPHPNPKFHPLRKGTPPKNLLAKVPASYRKLQERGWVYWKYPANIKLDGELCLYRPKTRERFSLNSSAWTIWRIKSKGGQSEDAAKALKQPKSFEVLRDIDELTLELRKKQFLI
ncbi:MAG: glycosyltransferase [Oligoflexia bacterium]|nr:glycosyltransferase [Oligoflexia bacterium]